MCCDCLRFVSSFCMPAAAACSYKECANSPGKSNVRPYGPSVTLANDKHLEWNCETMSEREGGAGRPGDKGRVNKFNDRAVFPQKKAGFEQRRRISSSVRSMMVAPLPDLGPKWTAGENETGCIHLAIELESAPINERTDGRKLLPPLSTNEIPLVSQSE